MQLRKCDAALETLFDRWVFESGVVQEFGVMQESRSFAYSLCQVEEGWRWSVYDEDGETVARGADVSRDRAQAAVELTLRCGAPEHAGRSLLG